MWLQKDSRFHLTSLKGWASSWYSDEEQLEVMAIGRNIRNHFLRLVVLLKVEFTTMKCPEHAEVSDDALIEKLVKLKTVSSMYQKLFVVVYTRRDCRFD